MSTAYVEWNGKKREMVGIGNNAFEECILSGLVRVALFAAYGFLAVECREVPL